MNDTAADGGALTVVAVGDAGHGTTQLHEGGSVTYVPNPGYTGTNRFTYTIRDAAGTESTGTVDVTVTPDVVVEEPTPIEEPIEEPVETPVDEPTRIEAPTAEPVDEAPEAAPGTSPSAPLAEGVPVPAAESTQQEVWVAQPTRRLPRTGSDVELLAVLGTVLSGLGGAALASLHRRSRRG